MMDYPISQYNQKITKTYLQTQLENQFFERKGLGEKETKPTKIADELIGMLNAEGGVLVFGISDKGEIQDLRSLGDKLDDYRRLLFDFIVFPCGVRLEEVEVDGKLIFLYHIPVDWSHIYCRKDNQKVFLRIADSNLELNWGQIKHLEYTRNLRRFEEEIMPDFNPDDLDYNLLEQYKQMVKFEGEDIFDLLYLRNLVEKKQDEVRFKKAAILLFARNPEHYLSSISVRYIRYDAHSSDEKMPKIVQDCWFEGNLPRLIEALSVMLEAELQDKSAPTSQLIYPKEAWLEGIVNALCHRSYYMYGYPVHIKVFEDRLEICNSGPFHTPVTVQNIRTERFSRNPRLARVLEDFQYVQQLNLGVPRIYRAMAQAGLPEPEYRTQNNNVCLILRRKPQDLSSKVQEMCS